MDHIHITTYIMGIITVCHTRVSALKSLMRKVLERLVGSAVDEEEEEEEEEAEKPGGTRPHLKGAHCTLATLCEWYETKNKVGDPAVSGFCSLTGRRYTC